MAQVDLSLSEEDVERIAEAVARRMKGPTQHPASVSLLTTDQVAQQLHISAPRVRQLIREGLLDSCQPGKKLLVRQEWVDDYLAGGAQVVS